MLEGVDKIKTCRVLMTKMTTTSRHNNDVTKAAEESNRKETHHGERVKIVTKDDKIVTKDE